MSNHSVIDLCSDDESNDNSSISHPQVNPRPQSPQSLHTKTAKADSSELANRVAELLAHAWKVPKRRAKSVDIRIRKNKAQQKSKRRHISSPPALPVSRTNVVHPFQHRNEQLASPVTNNAAISGRPEALVNSLGNITHEGAQTGRRPVHHGQGSSPLRTQISAPETAAPPAAAPAVASPSSAAASFDPLITQPTAFVSSSASTAPSSTTTPATETIAIDLTLSPSPPPHTTLPQPAPAHTGLASPPPLPAPLPPSSAFLARIPLAPPSPPPTVVASNSISAASALNQNRSSLAQNPAPLRNPTSNATTTASTAAVNTSVSSTANQSTRPRSRPWTSAQVAALGTQLQYSFDFEAFATAHGKTRADVFDVFSAVVQMPLLRFSERGVDRARRMREFRQIVRDFRGERKAVVGGISKGSTAGKK